MVVILTAFVRKTLHMTDLSFTTDLGSKHVASLAVSGCRGGIAVGPGVPQDIMRLCVWLTVGATIIGRFPCRD